MPFPDIRDNVHVSRFTCAIRDGAVSHFVPHEGNGYVPHVLKHRVLASYSAIAILLKALILVAPTVLPAAAVYSSAVTPLNIIKLTNVARLNAGLVGLDEESRLGVAAEGKAQDIIDHQYFAHVSPAGKTPWDWIRGAGYDYRHAGENLAIHFFDAEGVHEGWMASPTHKQNIVDARYREIGVGVAKGVYEGYDTVVVVQMFGTPKAAAAAAVIKPAPAPAPAPAPVPVPAAGKPEVIIEDGKMTPVAPASEPAPVVAAAESKQPVIDQPSVKVLPVTTPDAKPAYKIAAKVENAETVQAYLGPETIKLLQNPEGEWEGTLVPSGPIAEPQFVFVGATAPEGETTYEPVATVITAAPTVDVFTAGGRPSTSVKFLGTFEVHGLADGVKRFYLFAIMALLTALGVKVAVNYGRQRHSELAHTVFVVALFAVMYVI